MSDFMDDDDKQLSDALAASEAIAEQVRSWDAEELAAALAASCASAENERRVRARLEREDRELAADLAAARASELDRGLAQMSAEIAASLAALRGQAPAPLLVREVLAQPTPERTSEPEREEDDLEMALVASRAFVEEERVRQDSQRCDGDDEDADLAAALEASRVMALEAGLMIEEGRPTRDSQWDSGDEDPASLDASRTMALEEGLMMELCFRRDSQQDQESGGVDVEHAAAPETPCAIALEEGLIYMAPTTSSSANGDVATVGSAPAIAGVTLPQSSLEPVAMGVEVVHAKKSSFPGGGEVASGQGFGISEGAALVSNRDGGEMVTNVPKESYAGLLEVVDKVATTANGGASESVVIAPTETMAIALSTEGIAKMPSSTPEGALAPLAVAAAADEAAAQEASLTFTPPPRPRRERENEFDSSASSDGVLGQDDWELVEWNVEI